MKKLFKKFISNEKGSSAALIALAMTALLSMSAVAVDLGTAYVRTAEVQTAADAAVLAAGLMLPVAVNDQGACALIVAEAKEYLEKNGVEYTDDINIYLSGESGGVYTSIGVEVPAATETAFARVFGVGEITFTRVAESSVIPCVSISDVVPLSVQESVLDGLIASGNTEHVILKYGKKTTEVVNGAFGAIDLDGVNGGGANDYLSWLSYGYSGYLSIGDVLPVESGNMAGPTLAGVKARYNACAHYQSCGGCTAEHYEAGCPRVMKIPVIEYVTSGKTVRIVGFAAFVLEDYSTYSSQGYVVGTYVDMVNIGAVYGDVTGSAESYGVYSLTLSK